MKKILLSAGVIASIGCNTLRQDTHNNNNSEVENVESSEISELCYDTNTIIHKKLYERRGICIQLPSVCIVDEANQEPIIKDTQKCKEELLNIFSERPRSEENYIPVEK